MAWVAQVRAPTNGMAWRVAQARHGPFARWRLLRWVEREREEMGPDAEFRVHYEPVGWMGQAHGHP